VSFLVDTSVWSLALRRDIPHPAPEVEALAAALAQGRDVFIHGFVLQELLQGITGPKARAQIIEKLSALPLLVAGLQDHIDAAELRNACRRSGVQVGTIDALLAQSCIRYDLTMLTTDMDFRHIAKRTALKVWEART
jgi:hypothetical protein